ncbi:uncharacterized protein TNCT_305291 [Trichonephila clavata]|uniref:Uncharacterized protein n=1 Tax=Trichonephila clavata TaxID=2740835 RepID=A0A8X6KZ31_TRICU|nr:uncharacterized protein TNCT_305291 [Trichonephila clavata]
MNGKPQISSSCSFLLILAVQVILLVQGSNACLWCDKRQEERFLNCLFIDVVNNPEFQNAPVSSVDEMKWSILSTSDALKRTPNPIKFKLLDNLLVEETSKLTTTLSRSSGNSYDSVLETVVQLSGNCFTAATGQNSGFFKNELRQLVQDYNKKNNNPFDKAPDTAQSDGSSNQNPPLVNNNRQVQPPVNPNQPPSQSGNNRSPDGDGMNPGPGQQPKSLNQNPTNVFPPVPDNGNNFQPANDFSNGNAAPNPPQNDLNNGPGIPPSEQPSSSDVSGNNPVVSNPNAKSPSSDSSKTSTADQENSKSSNKMSENSKDTIESGSASKKEESGKPDEETCAMEFRKALYNRLVDDTQFTSVFGVVPYSSAKSRALQATKDAFKEYGDPKQGNDFSTLWNFESKSIPIKGNNKNYAEVLSKTIPIIFTRNHLLNEDDCEGQGKTFAEYILKSVSGRSNNNPVPTTGKPTVDSSEDQPSPGSNSDSSSQDSKSSNTDSSTPPDESTDTDSGVNSRKRKHHGKFSFGQFLKEIFGADNSTNEDTSTGNTPVTPTNLQQGSQDSSNFEKDIKESLSNTKSDYETIKNLKKLVSAAKQCVTPTGFDYNKLMTVMSEVTKAIQEEHPEWSPEKCQRKMYSLTVVAMSHALQELSESKKEKSFQLEKPGSSPSQPNNLQDLNSKPASNVPPSFNDHGFVPSGDSTNLRPAPKRPANNQFNNDNFRNFAPQNNPERNTRFQNPGTNINNPPPFGTQPNPAYLRPEQPLEFKPNSGNTFDSNLGNRNFQNPVPANNPPLYNRPNYGPTPQIPPQNDRYPGLNQGFNSGIPNANPNPGIQPIAPQTGGRQVQSPNFNPDSNLANRRQPMNY